MARKSKSSGATEVFDDFESLADRLMDWIVANARLVLVSAAVIVLAAAVLGGWATWSRDRELEASDALDRVWGAYLSAMGAPPTALEVPELANPEAARRIREDFAQRFATVADEHEGTVAGTLAGLEARELAQETGEAEPDPGAWDAAAEKLPGDSPLRGLLLQRAGYAHEQAGRWREAAESHEAAARVEGFPLRAWALADAARCFEEAGDLERALDLYTEAEAAPGAGGLPGLVPQQLQELRARLGRSTPAPVTSDKMDYVK